jgi:hypothetical protein
MKVFSLMYFLNYLGGGGGGGGESHCAPSYLIAENVISSCVCLFDFSCLQVMGQ